MRQYKSCIRELTVLRLKRSPFHCFVVVSSIILTMTLFITVLSMFSGILEVEKIQRFNYSGSDYHGIIYTDDEKIAHNQMIKEYSFVYEVLSSIPINNKEYMGLIISDSTVLSHLRGEIIGKWPESKNEILLHESTVKNLGLLGVIGEQLSLQIEGKEYEFILCGILTTNSTYNFQNKGILSLGWKEERDISVSPNLYIMLKNDLFIESSIKQILKDEKIKDSYFVNEAYVVNVFLKNNENMFLIIFLVALLMISGSLLIYNIFYISIVQDVEYYGLLKTIGLTTKQLKKVVNLHANILYIIACPIGIIIGYFAGFIGLAPLFLTLSNVEEVKISYLPIVLGSCLFTYITLRISIYKPKMIASKMTMIEATKYAGASNQSLNKGFTTKNIIWDITWNGILQRKNIIGITMLSIISGLIFFGVIYQATVGINLETYGKKIMPSNYVIESVLLNYVLGTDKETIEFTLDEYATVDDILNQFYEKEDNEDTTLIINSVKESMHLDEELYDKLEDELGTSNSNVEKLYSNFITLPLENYGKIEAEIIGIGAMATDFMDRNQDSFVTGSFDHEKFQSGDYVIITQSWSGADNKDESSYKIGDNITIDSKSYHIMAILPKWPGSISSLMTNSFSNGCIRVFMPEREFLGLDFLGKRFTKLLCETEDKSVMEKLKVNQKITIISKEERIASESNKILVLRVVGFGLSGILLLVGILNLFNTYFTTLYSRKLEFSILESIGMTKKQRFSMFVMEGGVYSSFIGVVYLTLGRYIIKYFTKKASEILSYISGYENRMMYVYILLSLVIIVGLVIVITARTMFLNTAAHRIKEV